MLDQNDLKWIATTSTELTAMLQQISRYSDLARQHKGEYNYIDMLSERAELAAKTAQALFDRVTSAILQGGSRAAGPRTEAPPAFTVMPPPPEVALRTPAPAESPTPASSKMPRVYDHSEIMNPKGARELILVVDDEAEVAQLAGEMLADDDYRVILAKDGFEALKIYQAMGPKVGLVILDFFLPIMDGDAVFDELRAINPNVNVVLSSGFAEQSKLGGMLAQGLRGFIPKPYTRQKLLEQVRSILDSAR